MEQARFYFLSFAVLIFLIGFVSAVRINEVELNPAGSDAGAEWIELYSEQETNLESYKLVNEDDGELKLNGSFLGFFVVNFEKQWLDNGNAKVFLYKGDEKIDETDLLNDNKNNDESWQFCSQWELKKSTKGEDNVCSEKIEESEENENNPENVSLDEETEEIEENETSNENIDDTANNEQSQETEIVKTNSNKSNQDKNIINLNPQEETINTKTASATGNVIYESKNEIIKRYGIYFFALFLLFVIFVLVIRR